MRRRALFSRLFQSFLWKIVPPMLRPAIVVQNLANARRWGLDRRAEIPSKPGLQAMLPPFALPLSGVATANLPLGSGE